MTESLKESEEKILRRLRVWIGGIAAVCLISGIIFGLFAANGFVVAEKTEEPQFAPDALSASFAQVAKKVEPAVVNIDTKGKVPEISFKSDDSTVPNELSESLENESRRRSFAVGSGFIVEKTGYILTNSHVVENSSRILVRLQSGEEFVAKIVGTDEETDLAVLKIEAGKDLPTVKFGDSEAIQVGDWVLAIGSPFGLAQSVTAGIISQVKRETPYSKALQRFIQTDAAINRGNSGGPLLNMNGEVIGVNSQIATTTGDFNGIGFALPAKEAAFVYRQILANGKVRRGYLGVTPDSVKKEFAKIYGLPEPKGAIVTAILDKASPAAKAGLAEGDIITQFNGEQVLSAQDLIAKVASVEPEKDVTVIFLRENGNNLEQKSTVVKLGERLTPNQTNDTDTPKKLPLNKSAISPNAFSGLVLTEITAQLSAVYNLEGQKGVLVKTVDPASFLADIRSQNGVTAINPGDLIQRINRQFITDLKSFNEAAAKLKAGDAVVLHIANYNRQSRTVRRRIVQFTIQ